MTTIAKRLALAALLSAAFSGSAQEKSAAEAMFYTGPAQVQSIAGTIDLESAAIPKLSVKLSGLKGGSVGVAIGAGDPVRLESVDLDKGTVLPLVIRRKGGPSAVQDVQMDLRVFLDGRPAAAPIGKAEIALVLPKGVPALIRSNQPATRGTSEDGRVTYRLQDVRYLTMWRVGFTTGPVTLQMEKRLEPSGGLKADQQVVVKLQIRNLGPGDARGVDLFDDLDPRDFAAVRDKGFSSYAGDANDRRLLWRGSVAQLAPGAETTVAYEVKALRPVHSVSLPAARAAIDGKLVGLSNKVVLPPGR